MDSLTAALSAGRRAPLKLCLAAESFYPVYAGPAVRFRRYLPGFTARGMDVRVFTATPSGLKAKMSGLAAEWDGRRYGDLMPTESVCDVPLHRVCVPDRRGFRRSLMFNRKLVEFCRGPGFYPDIIQLLSLPFSATAAMRRLRRMGVPTVFTKTMLPEVPSNPIKRELMRRYIGWPLESVSCVVVSSCVMRARVEELAVKTRVEVIPNGVDTERFRPRSRLQEGRPIRRSLRLNPDDVIVTFAGPVSPRKGVDLLLEAWCRLAPRHPTLHLVIVGPRRDQVDSALVPFRRKLEGLLDESGARERVHFVGLVENVEEYLRASDVFVFTSRREGMPNVVPEAMASGLPVVTTPFIGLPSEFGCAGRHYVLADFEPDRLAGAIDVVLRDEAMRRVLGASARSWIEETMSVERSLDSYAQLYRDLAIPPRKGSGAKT